MLVETVEAVIDGYLIESNLPEAGDSIGECGGTVKDSSGVNGVGVKAEVHPSPSVCKSCLFGDIYCDASKA